MDALSRPIKITCCKDRTLAIMQPGEKPFNGVALPVFSVNTLKQAEDLITLVGIVQYEPHPLLPGQPWRKIDIEFKRWLELDDLPAVTEKLQSVFDRLAQTIGETG